MTGQNDELQCDWAGRFANSRCEKLCCDPESVCKKRVQSLDENWGRGDVVCECVVK